MDEGYRVSDTVAALMKKGVTISQPLRCGDRRYGQAGEDIGEGVILHSGTSSAARKH